MIGATSLLDVSCLQYPVQADSMLDLTQTAVQGPNTAVWFQKNYLQQQQHGTCVLPQSSKADLDPSLWALQQQQGGLALSPTQLQQLQALQGAKSAATDLGSLSSMLQHSNKLISLPLPQAQGIAMDGRQVIFEVQGNPSTQSIQQVSTGTNSPMQHVIITASGEQLLVLNPGGHDAMPQQQQQGLLCVDPCTAAGNGPSMDLQLQQLQEAINSLSNQSTAVQQVLLGRQCSQPQGSSPTMGPLLHLELASSMSPSAPGFSSLALPAQSAATAMASGSFAGCYSQDSLSSSSSWQYMDPSSGSNSSSSSPLLRLQGCGLLAASPAAAGASGQGASNLSILRSPQMPQPCSQLGTPMSSPQIRPYSLTNSPQIQGQMQSQMQGQMQGMQGFSSSSSSPSATHSWTAGANSAALQPSSSSSSSQQVSAATAHMGCPGQRILLPGGHVFDYGTTVLQHQSRPGSTAAGAPYMQRQFKGNTPFKFSPGRTAFAPPPRAPAPAAAPAARPAASGSAHSSAGAAAAQGAKSAAAAAAVAAPGSYASVTLQEGLALLWSAEQLQAAAGGLLFNVQHLAWHPVGEPDPDAQDMYNFQKLKRMVQKLDAVHKTRVKLIKRIHAVADRGGCDLKSVYREVRGLVGELLHDSAMQIRSLEECRVTGLVRMALMLQEALVLGPKLQAQAAAEATPGVVCHPV